MAADMIYVFGDLLTGQVNEEIANVQSVQIAETLSDSELRGTIHLDETGKDNESVTGATVPGRSYVVAERDGTPIFGGIVWSRTYQSQSKSLQLYCKGFKGYTSKRFITTDLNLVGDQIGVFLDLYNDMQSDPNSVIVDLPSEFSSGVEVEIDAKASELKTYRQVIDSFADSATGFDWIINVSRVGGVYLRQLQIGHPTIGSLVNHGTVTFDYPGNITNYWKTEALGEAGTNIYGVGSGEGDTALIASAIDTVTLENGSPRYDHSVAFKDVNNLSLLESRTLQELVTRRSPMPVFTVEVKGDHDPQFGDYGMGDACRLHFLDPMHPMGFIKTTRILGWEYYPSSDESVELVRIIFEGDEEAT